MNFPNEYLDLSKLKERIPKRCFEKSLFRSILYMVFDLLLLSTSIFTYSYLNYSWIGLLIYWNIYGFIMWCLFVVGHDCGHNTFSKYPIVNAVCGHLCHTLLFVPFFPWAYSHRKHHQYHNHKDKDMSHPWFTKEQVARSFSKKYLSSSFLAPFVVYWIYLYPGEYDGSHVLPTGKLFQGSKNEQLKCVISTLSLISFATLLSTIFSSWTEFMLFYGGSLIFFSFWLFMVTYMQHHHDEIILYNDSNWNFLDGALETVDRSYGFGIDRLHHNITDGHVVHHLFFTQIPHYHLREATQSIVPLLGKKYKYKKHKFFLKDFWVTFFNVKFDKWKLAPIHSRDRTPKKKVQQETVLSKK